MTRQKLPALVLGLLLGLLLGLVGTGTLPATAGPGALTAGQVKKLVKKTIKKQAPTLSVASAARADTVDGFDSTNLLQTPGQMRVLAAGNVDTDGTLLSKVGNFTLVKTGTGEYTVVLNGNSADNHTDIISANPGIGFSVRALIQLGTARFYSYNQAMNPFDAAFFFVIYRVG
jgi:hypothetical protein